MESNYFLACLPPAFPSVEQEKRKKLRTRTIEKRRNGGWVASEACSGNETPVRMLCRYPRVFLEDNYQETSHANRLNEKTCSLKG